MAHSLGTKSQLTPAETPLGTFRSQRFMTDNVGAQGRNRHMSELEEQDSWLQSEEHANLELPPDVLHMLCLFASGHQLASMLEPRVQLFALTRTPELQALGSCCKLLKGIFDSLRPSIHFHADAQPDAGRYLQKLPSLSKVSIFYSDDGSDIECSLKTLHTHLPHLTSLQIRLNLSREGIKPVNAFNNSLLAWSGTLQRLHLTGMNINPGTSGGSFNFLSKLPMLTELKFHNILPFLKISNLASCSSLVKLHIEISLMEENINEAFKFIDLSSCKELQELSCTNYSLEGLNLTGLHKLQRLDCSSNYIDELDVSTCTSLRYLACMDNWLKVLDVTSCCQLVKLECSSNDLLENLHVSGCKYLAFLCYSGTWLEELDLSGCTGLTDIDCGKSHFQTLDLQPCLCLESLDATANRWLHNISLCGMMHLRTVQMQRSHIVTIDVSDCIALESVDCDNCGSLEVVHVNGCSKLQSLLCNTCPKLREVGCKGCVRLDQIGCVGSGAFDGVTLAQLLAQ